MKLLCRPSLFRRYLVTTVSVVFAMAAALVSYFWFVKPSPDMVESDMLLIVRALASFADAEDVETARNSANKVIALNAATTPTALQANDAHYAIFRQGILFLESENAPRLLLESLAVVPPAETVNREGWFLRAETDTKSGSVVVFALSERYAQQSIREALLSGLSFSMLVYLLFALLVAFIASYFALRPLERLAKRIRELDIVGFARLDPQNLHYEFEPVVAAINERSRALQAQIEAERVFFSSAAHELRTPLAVINAQAHGVSKAIGETERAQRVTELQRGVDRAASALGRMLQLARLDSALPAPTITRTNLSEVAADCVAFHAPRAFANEQTLSLQDGGDTGVLADRDDLVTIIDNLLDNAINYAGRGATITVDIRLDRPTVHLTIADDGPGFSESDHTTAFERFRRGTQSETHPGSGLGLAIVKAAAARAGGSVDAANVVNGRGLSVAVRLRSSIPH
jgi:signal transduction histidine kinase